MEKKLNGIRVIAEIANAHQGDPETAEKLVKAAAESGADVVKFQVYFAEELLTRDHPRYRHFKEQAFSEAVWRSLFRYAKNAGLAVFADVFGLRAFSVASKYGADGYKVHSSDLVNAPLLKILAGQDKTVLLSTGGSTIMEIRYAIDHITSLNKPSEVVLMHGFQAYPTSLSDSSLSRIRKLKDLFGDPIKMGYQDHASPDDNRSMMVPLLAIPYGISYIEKHITLDRRAKGVDYYSSLEPAEFKNFVGSVRAAESVLGADPLRFSDAEKKYRKEVKKSWVCVKDLAAGTVIKDGQIEMKRARDFNNPPLYEKIVHNKLAAGLKREESVTNLDIGHKVLAVIVARCGSSRLPNKALLDINGRPAIEHLFRRLKICKDKGYVSTIAFCTTIEPADAELAEIAKDYPFKVYRGPVEDVLSRMMLAIDDNSDHDITLRITGDDLLIDPEYLKKTVEHHLKTNSQYTDAKSLPSGTEVEAFDSSVLKLIHELSKDSSGSEYLTNYIKNNEDQFNTSSLPVKERHRRNYRLTLDTPEDYELIKKLLAHMKSSGREFTYGLNDIVRYFNARPKMALLNKKIKQRSVPKHVNTDMEWQHVTRNPSVTVYIPNHNYGRYIKQAIDSVLEQKYRNYELLIIDDGSTDDSRKIIERYRNHPKVRIVHQENKGLNVTNNIALKLSRGKYIMRLDADDYLDENALLVMSAKIEKDPELGMVFPDYYMVDEKGSVLSHERRHDFKKVTVMDQPAHGACTMIRKSFLSDVGGYSEDFRCQDGYELWMKFINRFKVGNINLPLFYYRQHPNSLTKDQDKILLTRSMIIKNSAGRIGVGKKNICIIPIRGEEEGAPKALVQIAGRSFMERAVDGALDAERISQVILTTPDERIITAAEKRYGRKIIIDRRPEELSAINRRLEDTVDHLFARYPDRLKNSDTFTLANYEYPLRKSAYIDKAVNSLYLFDVDSVISVKQRGENFYKHEGGGLISFSTNAMLRLERDYVYEEIGGIHIIKCSSYRKFGSIICGRIGHILMDDASCLRVVSGQDLAMADFISAHSSGK